MAMAMVTKVSFARIFWQSFLPNSIVYACFPVPINPLTTILLNKSLRNTANCRIEKCDLIAITSYFHENLLKQRFLFFFSSWHCQELDHIYVIWTFVEPSFHTKIMNTKIFIIDFIFNHETNPELNRLVFKSFYFHSSFFSASSVWYEESSQIVSGCLSLWYHRFI